MGKRKAESARIRKAAKAERAMAILRNCPLSPRKVRLVADMVRGLNVNQALNTLRYAPQAGAPYMERVLMSALANWGQKHPEAGLEESDLVVKTLMVDEGRSLKRIRPRAQGRAARILKRSCHIMIEVAERPAEEAKPVKKGHRAEKEQNEKAVTE